MPSFTSYSSSTRISEGKLTLLWITSSIVLVIAIIILDQTVQLWSSIIYVYRVIAVLFMILLATITFIILYDVSTRAKRLENEFSKRVIEDRELERKRISSELHDSVQQDLHSINFEINNLARSYHPVKWKLDELSERINLSINNIRNISSNLYPHMLKKLGFKKAIMSMVNELTASSEIYFNAKISDEIEEHINYDKALNIYRVIQELCNNIIKHSFATQAEIKLYTDKASFILIISDNGKGFSNDFNRLEQFREGLGLSNIQQRISYMQGNYKINSKQGKGLSFEISLPLKK